MLRSLGFAAVLLIALATAVVVPVGAGAAEVVNHKRLATQVSATVGATYPELPVTSVQCPKTIKAKTGATALCTATAGGLSLQMRVTVTDRTGGVTIESTQALIAKAAAESLVRLNATLPVEVDCGPDAYIVRPPGVPFVCTARFPSDGTVQQVMLSPGDVAGTVTITQVL